MLFGSDSKTPSLKNLIILWVAFSLFSSACNSPAPFEEAPEQIQPLSMLLGPVEVGADVSIEAPGPAVGATLDEGMSVRLQAEGLAPLFAEVKSKGTWESKGDAERTWILKNLEYNPESGRLGKKLKERLSTMALPADLPLGPYSLLTGPVGDHDFPLSKISFDRASGLRIEGRWRCTRTDGRSAGALPASELSCVLEGGRLIQEGKGPHTGTVIEARLVGTLHAIRGASDAPTPNFEELRMELVAQSETPTRLSFKTSYYRIWCAVEGACSGSGS